VAQGAPGGAKAGGDQGESRGFSGKRELAGRDTAGSAVECRIGRPEPLDLKSRRSRTARPGCTRARRRLRPVRREIVGFWEKGRWRGSRGGRGCAVGGGRGWRERGRRAGGKEVADPDPGTRAHMGKVAGGEELAGGGDAGGFREVVPLAGTVAVGKEAGAGGDLAGGTWEVLGKMDFAGREKALRAA